MINEAILSQRKMFPIDLKNANLFQRSNCFIRKNAIDRRIFDGLTETKKPEKGAPGSDDFRIVGRVGLHARRRRGKKRRNADIKKQFA